MKRKRIHSIVMSAALLCGCLVSSSQGETEAGITSVNGFSQPSRPIDVAAADSGIIGSVEVKEGDDVSKGQVLVRLDSKILELAATAGKLRKESTGKLSSLNAVLAYAERKLAKLQKLGESGAATSAEIESSGASVDIARAALREEEEAKLIQALEYDSIIARIERRKIRSPIDGTVLEIVREVSESVTLSDAHVVTVAQLDPLLITCYVSPQEAGQVKAGQRTAVEFVHSGLTATGKVETVSPVIDPESSTVRVRVLVPNAKRQYSSGARCRVMFFAAKQPAEVSGE